MTKFTFFPHDWKPSDELIEWTKAKGLDDKMIDAQVEEIIDHQYKTPRERYDACWRNWIRNGIQWGRIVPITKKEYRQVEVISEEQKKRDDAAGILQMDNYRKRQ